MTINPPHFPKAPPVKKKNIFMIYYFEYLVKSNFSFICLFSDFQENVLKKKKSCAFTERKTVFIFIQKSNRQFDFIVLYEENFELEFGT